MPDTIAFISNYQHPSRDSIEWAVREAFPEYRFQNVSVSDLVKNNRQWRLPNLYFLAKEYGFRLAKRDVTVIDSYFRTGYLFRKLHAAMADIVQPERHVFTFQVQSLFDTSVPGVPHFVYTDHTHLSTPVICALSAGSHLNAWSIRMLHEYLPVATTSPPI